MITIKCEAPIALDSDDHIHPDGIFVDNNLNPNFVNEVENLFKRKINFLDVGCAGGELVCEFLKRGHNAVGVDGSDACLNFESRPSEDFIAVKTYHPGIQRPTGFENWKQHGNKNLFTADVTKNFQIFNNGTEMKFDLITAWDVLEHFYPERIDTFIDQIKKHLNPESIFIASIAQFSFFNHISNVEYHKSNFPTEWWLKKLSPHFEIINYPFVSHNRNLDHRYLLFCGKIK